jgi:hypothetical protein
MKTEWRVDASYEGYDPAYDKDLEKLVGRESCGSGFCLLGGLRDMGWTFKQKPAAHEAAKKLRRKHRVKMVTLTHWDEDYNNLIDEIKLKG